MNNDPVLVIGVQRSGTTLVGRLLAEHEDVCLTINGKLLYYLISWIYRDPFAYPGAHLRLDEIAYALTRRSIGGIGYKEFEKMIEMLKTRFRPTEFFGQDRDDIVRRIWLEVYQEISNGASVIGDKYNEYMLQLPEICTIFPSCRYVFVHRHPFAVAESMVRAFKGRPWAPETISSALFKWTVWNEEWLRSREAIEPALRLEISYQQIVDEPESTFRSICDFLGLACSDYYIAKVRTEVKPEQTRLDGIGDIDLRSLPPEFKGIGEQLGYRL